MKKRFKLYKSGKLWCTAAVMFAAFTISTTNQVVHADSNTSDPSSTQVVSTQTFDTTTTNSSATSSAALDDQKVATTPSNEVPVDTTTQNNDQNANDGSLDHAQVSTNQQIGQTTLNAQGWQATGESNTERYRYAILYDNTTNSEINRQRVTPVQRDDVKQAYSNVANSDLSGFNVNFSLPNNLAGHSVSVVARYSTDAINGESQHTDYWFAPIIIDNQNRASLDNLSSDQDGNLHVSGWHASNQALDKKYHYIIAYDQTQGHEIARQLVTPVSRQDVANAYPTIGNAAYSGFNVSFKLTKYAQDDIQFISRWTDDPAGNGNAVDYWFGPVTKQNRGNLDSWNLSDGTLQVSGWHADDASIYEPYHFLILYDNTANQQVASKAVVTEDSSDVASAYPDTRSANKSRFNTDFSGLQLTAGHSYSLVSRYSSSSSGNGNDGTHTDYWYPAQTLNQSAYSIDSISSNGSQITLSGWFANDDAVNDAQPFVIMLVDGKEVARHAVTMTQRADVANAYPGIYNSLNSGFSTTFDLPNNISENIQFVLRYSNQADGEGQRSDIYTRSYASNAGNFDSINVGSNQLQVSGWHAIMNSTEKPYQYIIIVDADDGHEYGRWQVTSNVARSDVQSAYPWISDSANSGFNMTIDNSSFNHHNIRIIHRYTDDPAGNGNYTDYESDVIHVHSWYKIGNATYHLNDNQQIDYVLNDAPAISQRPDLVSGCEMTAVNMMLQYAGVNISKEQVAAETPRSDNPYAGFMGNPYSMYGVGLWVAPSGIASVVSRHLGNVINMTGWSLDSLKNQLINRHLVVTWMAHMHGFGTHAITLTGFDGSGFFYNDPWTGEKNAHMSYATFDYYWRDDKASRGALSY